MHLFSITTIICLSVVFVIIGGTVIEASTQCLYDFERTKQGWVPETHQSSQGALSAKRSKLVALSGGYSLKVELNLSKQVPERSQGEIRVDLQSYPPANMSLPLDLENKIVTAYVYFPEEFGGQAGSPNGIQLFVKSDKDLTGKEQWRSLYGQWIDAVGQAGDWVEVRLVISAKPSDGIYVEDGFNTKSIRFIGIKFGIGRKASSNVEFSGDIFVDCISW